MPMIINRIEESPNSKRLVAIKLK